MANIGTAPALATAPTLLGPVSSQSGFQYWYLACFPDSIVAIRQGMGAMFILGMANDDGMAIPHLFGLVGLLINYLVKPKALAYRRSAEAAIRNTPTSRLRMKPNVVYDLPQLKSITCKPKKGAPLILSEIILETKSGSKQKFGIRPAEFEKACEQLPQRYSGLCKMV